MTDIYSTQWYASVTVELRVRTVMVWISESFTYLNFFCICHSQGSQKYQLAVRRLRRPRSAAACQESTYCSLAAVALYCKWMMPLSEWALPRTRGKSDCPSGTLGHRKLTRLAPSVDFRARRTFFSTVTMGSAESLAERLGGLYGDTCPFPPGSHV